MDARRLAPPVVAELVAQSRAAIGQGRYRAAVARLDSAASFAPALADIHYLRGLALAGLKRFEQSRSAFKEAREVDPYYPGVRFQLGHLDFQQEAYRAALDHYTDELALVEAVREGRIVAPEAAEGARPVLLVQIGRCHGRMGEMDAAYDAYARALAIDSTFVPALTDLARLEKENGAFESALTYVQRALRHSSENADLRYLRAQLQLQLGRSEQAAADLQFVADREPWNAGAIYNLARALTLSGREAKAERYYARADSMQKLQQQIDQARAEVHLHPDRPRRWMELAHLLDRIGHEEGARQARLTAERLARK